MNQNKSADWVESQNSSRQNKPSNFAEGLSMFLDKNFKKELSLNDEVNVYNKVIDKKTGKVKINEFMREYSESYSKFLSDNDLDKKEFNFEQLDWNIEFENLINDVLVVKFSKLTINRKSFVNAISSKVNGMDITDELKEKFKNQATVLSEQMNSSLLVESVKTQSTINNIVENIVNWEVAEESDRKEIKSKINPDFFEKWNIDIDSLSTEQKLIFGSLVNEREVLFDDIKDLFKENVIADNLKLKFLKEYLPTISLEDAINLNIISTKSAENFIISELNGSFSSEDGLSKGEIKTLLSNNIENITDTELNALKKPLLSHKSIGQISLDLFAEHYSSIDFKTLLQNKIKEIKDIKPVLKEIISIFNGEGSTDKSGKKIDELTDGELLKMFHEEVLENSTNEMFKKMSKVLWITGKDVIDSEWKRASGEVKKTLIKSAFDWLNLSQKQLKDIYKDENKIYGLLSTRNRNVKTYKSDYANYNLSIDQLEGLLNSEDSSIVDEKKYEKIFEHESAKTAFSQDLGLQEYKTNKLILSDFKFLQKKIKEINPSFKDASKFEKKSVFRIVEPDNKEVVLKITWLNHETGEIEANIIYTKAPDSEKYEDAWIRKSWNALDFVSKMFDPVESNGRPEYLSPENLNYLREEGQLGNVNFEDFTGLEVPLDIANMTEFLNDSDPDGKEFHFQEWLNMFITWGEGKLEILTIDTIDEESDRIVISSNWDKDGETPYVMSFKEFYASFSEKSAKRFWANLNSINHFNNVVSDRPVNTKLINNKLTVNGFENSKLKDEFNEQDGQYIGTKFFKITANVNANNLKFEKGEAIEIWGLMPNGKVQVKFWKYDEGETKTSFMMPTSSKKWETYSLSELYFILNLSDDIEPYNSFSNRDAKPYNKEKINANKDTKQKLGLLGHYMNFYSAADIANSIELIVNGVWDWLKKDSDMKATKLAAKLGKIIPSSDVQDQLTIKSENEEKSMMDSVMDDLKKIDSNIATDRIEKWLLDSSTLDYKKEAWMLFMLKEYGHLSAKSLAKYQGKFIWYTSMWGKVWDELYTNTKRDCESKWIAFSEELLMFYLINRQCKGKLKPKRRSRLHKEFKALWWVGIEWDRKKGSDDASMGQDFDARIGMVKWEIAWGTYSNAWWAFEASIGKAWDGNVMSMKNANSALFYLMATWASRSLDGDRMWDKIKNHMSDGMPMNFLWFVSKPSRTDVFMKAMVAVSEKVSELNKKNVPWYQGKELAEMESKAKKIYEDSLDLSQWNWNSRCGSVYKFWEIYGDLLSRSLWMLAGTDDKYQYTDKLVMLNPDGNHDLAEYKKQSDTAFSALLSGFHVNKDLMDDPFDQAGTSWSYIKWAIKCLKLDYHGSYTYKWKKMIKEIKNDLLWSGSIKWIRDKTYVYDPNKSDVENAEANKKAQFKLYKSVIVPLIAGILENNKTNIRESFKWTHLGWELLSLWIDLTVEPFITAWITDVESCAAEETPKQKAVNEKINDIIEKIMQKKNNIREGKISDSTRECIDSVKWLFEEKLNKAA